MKSLKEINEYIENNKDSVSQKYRLKYHMMPPVGWMNDPNGLVFHNGAYHLFYQANPFKTLPGVMHWGGFLSSDLITYSDLNVRIAPTKDYDNIFSGGALSDNGVLKILYTVHHEKDGLKTETINYRDSVDGISFSDERVVFSNESLPKGYSRNDFRDPSPYKIGDDYYCFIGGKKDATNEGVIIVLKGKRLDCLTYFFTIGPFYELGDMGECPSYVHLPDYDLLIASGCHVKRRNNDFKNENSSLFILGHLDFVKGKMDIEKIQEIDKGDTFYAPQFINGSQKPVMIGWMEMWGKPYPLHEMKAGWNGAFTIPRIVTIRNGEIYQQPISSLENYYCQKETNAFDLSYQALRGSILTVKGTNGSFTISLDDYLSLDTNDANNLNGQIRRTNHKYEKVNVRLLVDTSSVEIFVNDGLETITSRHYLDGPLKIISNAFVKELKIHYIEVN